MSIAIAVIFVGCVIVSLMGELKRNETPKQKRKRIIREISQGQCRIAELTGQDI